MTYIIIPTPQFEKDINFYLKKRKYTKITKNINEVMNELENGNLVGREISGIGLPEQEDVFKVKVANTSANLGKSNGFRVIYYAIKNDREIYLLTVYSKKDKEDISNKEVVELIRKYCM